MTPIDFHGQSIPVTPEVSKKLVAGLNSKEKAQLLKDLGGDSQHSEKYTSPETAEAERTAWEQALNACQMHSVETAQAFYEQASDNDKTYLRKALSYEKKSVVVRNPVTGAELFRSHGMIQPISLLGRDTFVHNSYTNGVSNQTNIEAQWRHLFDAPKGAPKGTYQLRKDVVQSAGMQDNITAGNQAEWNKIFSLFSSITTNNSNQYNAGMQVARQMLGISGYIWTNEKISSAYARHWKLLPESCKWRDNVVGYLRMSVVGLENLQHAA